MHAFPRTTPRALGACIALALALVSGCAAQSKSGAPAEAAPSQQGYAQQGGGYPPSTAQGAPSQPGFAPAPPPAPPPSPEASPSTPAKPPQAAGTTSDRSVAIRAASSDVESSQRELDMAGGDCRNACRALGSMDRAAGRLCELVQAADEGHRCTDAKTRVYSARDRVRTTCGSCPNGPSVERTAPIPSLR